MSIFDKLLNAVKLNDDYDDDEDFFDEDEPEEAAAAKPKKRFFKKMDDAELDDDDDDNIEEAGERKSFFSKAVSKEKAPSRDADAPAPKAKPAVKPKASSKITPMKRTTVSSYEVCVIKPKDMEDTREIADTLLDSCTVVLNLEGIDVEVAQRVIDFSSGTCYAIGGSLQKVSSYIFIMTPAGVEISGDFQQILNNSFDMPSIRTSF